MITIAELREWLRAEEEDDALIEELMTAAIAHVENVTGKHYGTSGEVVQSVTWNGWPIALQGTPEGAVTLEKWSGTAWEAVDAGNYYVDGDFIRPAGSWTFSEPWPRFRATYAAGYTDGLQPAPIRLAVKMLVQAWYDGQDPDPVERAVRALLRPYTRTVV